MYGENPESVVYLCADTDTQFILPKVRTDFNMRMRKKKNSDARIERCAEFLVKTPEDLHGSGIYAPFPEKLHGLPVSLELGCGKGGFICEMAKAHPDRLFYAVERIDSVILFALERRAAQMAESPELPDNVRFISGNAAAVGEWFPEGTLSDIYLNFSDPWPKKGYYKRRMTYREFLAVYARVLAPDGELHVKTDNVTLFDFTLEEIAASPFSLIWQTRDLHNSEYADGNIMTEYERRFTEEGIPINALCARNGR